MSNVEKNSVTGGFFSSYLPPSEKEMLISGCCLMSRNRAQPLPVVIGWQWGKQSQELRFLFLFCLDCASWNKNWRLIAYMALYLSFMGYIPDLYPRDSFVRFPGWGLNSWYIYVKNWKNYTVGIGVRHLFPRNECYFSKTASSLTWLSHQVSCELDTGQ